MTILESFLWNLKLQSTIRTFTLIIRNTVTAEEMHIDSHARYDKIL